MAENRQKYFLAEGVRAVDGRVKIALLIAYSIALLVAPSFWGLGAAAVLLVAVMLAGRLSVWRIARDASFVYLICAFLLVYHGATQGWSSGVMVVARIVLLVWASLALMALSTPTELADALRKVLAPLGRWGLPVRDFTTALSIALRFIPLLAEELAAVRAAQASRGAAFEGPGMSVRLRAYGGMMTPVFVGLFRRADRLAQAMDARCFGATEAPTSLAERGLTLRDGGVFLVGVIACCAFALL